MVEVRAVSLQVELSMVVNRIRGVKCAVAKNL
jgi:hypothetical protein